MASGNNLFFFFGTFAIRALFWKENLGKCVQPYRRKAGIIPELFISLHGHSGSLTNDGTTSPLAVEPQIVQKANNHWPMYWIRYPN